MSVSGTWVDAPSWSIHWFALSVLIRVLTRRIWRKRKVMETQRRQQMNRTLMITSKEGSSKSLCCIFLNARFWWQGIMDPGDYRCAHVGYCKREVWGPSEPFASFAFCIVRIIDHLTRTLRHSVCTLQKHKIISYKDHQLTLRLCFSMDFMSDFDMMLQRKKSMSGKRRRNRDGGTFISDADDVVSAMIVKMNEAAEVSFPGSRDTLKFNSLCGKIVWLIR